MHDGWHAWDVENIRSNRSMSTDEKPPMPPQPKTTEMAAVKVPTTQLDELLAMAKAHGETLKVVKDGFFDLTTRMANVEERMESAEQRLKRNSTRATMDSQQNLEQEAKIAAQAQATVELQNNSADTNRRVTALEGALAQNTAMTAEIRTAVTGFFQKHPAVATAFVNLILAALGFATWWLTTYGGHQ